MTDRALLPLPDAQISPFCRADSYDSGREGLFSGDQMRAYALANLAAQQPLDRAGKSLGQINYEGYVSIGARWEQVRRKDWWERAAIAVAAAVPPGRFQMSELMFDAFGDPRTRYVRVSLSGNHCVMHPSEGDVYLKDAKDSGDGAAYVVADVYLSEREFDALPEHDGF